MFLKYIFISFAILLCIMLVFYKLHVQKQQRTPKVESYVSSLTGAFALYVVSALILAIFIKGGLNKALMVLFALSPFIIGYFATYKKESLFCYIQIAISFISAFTVFLL